MLTAILMGVGLLLLFEGLGWRVGLNHPYAGGWSTNSNVLEAKYIDFAMAPSKAAYIFFGHLKRDKPLDA